MGRVYLAEHVRMGRNCAVKVMNPKLLYDPDSVSRFSREAANASRITHPNVAAIYDFGESDDIVYIAMEYVDGPSLAGILAKERRLNEQRVIGIGTQVADALTAAHDFGIVHRDLKPDNVMLTRSRTGEDMVKVVDFGIAKATQGARQTVTRTGFVIGTPAYMSPEQILGDVLDGRSDIYSLGCILYEMVTGARVFAGTSGEVSIHQRLTEPAPRPRLVHGDVSKGLDDVVAKALARSPDQRFQSAAALREALTGALAGAGGDPPPSATTVLRHRSSRTEGPRSAGLFAAFLVVLGIGVATWLWLRPHGGPQESQPLKIPVAPTAPVASTPAAPPAPTPAAPPTRGGDAQVKTGGDEAPAGPTPTPTPPPAAGNRGGVAFEEPLPPDARVTVDGKETRGSERRHRFARTRPSHDRGEGPPLPRLQPERPDRLGPDGEHRPPARTRGCGSRPGTGAPQGFAGPGGSRDHRDPGKPAGGSGHRCGRSSPGDRRAVGQCPGRTALGEGVRPGVPQRLEPGGGRGRSGGRMGRSHAGRHREGGAAAQRAEGAGIRRVSVASAIARRTAPGGGGLLLGIADSRGGRHAAVGL